jgi:hypothetical protein
MSHGTEDHGAPFSGLESPAPPPALRGRVLMLAREELARAEAPDVWTRIWESRPLRAAWAAATLLLVAAHVAVTVRPPARGGRAPAPVAAPASDSASELAAVAGLSPLKEELLPRLEASTPAPSTGPKAAPSAPAVRNRKGSAS